MRLAALFSGGKDSSYALYKASAEHEICCLITMKSKNKESYMFHTPNIEITELQAEALGYPLISSVTSGEKEKEIGDLKEAVKRAVGLFRVEGIVSGAIGSIYQAERIQRICSELGLWCFNPLWQLDQLALLEELIKNKFEAVIIGVFAYPLDDSWLGKKIDHNTLQELKILKDRFKINPAGEGGEYESLVLDCPIFSKKIIIKSAEKIYKDHAGIYKIKEAVLQ